MKKLILMACIFSFLGAPSYALRLKNDSNIKEVLVKFPAAELAVILEQGTSTSFSTRNLKIGSISWVNAETEKEVATCQVPDTITMDSPNTITLTYDASKKAYGCSGL